MSAGSASFAGKVTSASTQAADSGTTLATKDYVDANAGGSISILAHGIVGADGSVSNSGSGNWSGGSTSGGGANPTDYTINTNFDIPNNATITASTAGGFLGATVMAFVSATRQISFTVSGGNNVAPINFILVG